MADLRALPAGVKDVFGFALRGIKTPKPDLDLVRQRLKLAQDRYETLIRDDI